LTDDRRTISKGIRKAKMGDGTSLYDALQNVFKKQISLIEGRKALVLLTDGVDTTSFKAKYESSLIEAEKYDVPIFPVYFDTFESITQPVIRNGGLISGNFPPITFPRSSIEQARADYELGKFYLNDLVALSGGRAFSVDDFKGNEEKLFESLVEELSSRYYASFAAAETSKNFERRRIIVRVNRQGHRIRARGSYLIK
jgi:hypothetical protein